MRELFPELLGVVITLAVAYCFYKAHEPTKPPFRASIYSFILAILLILIFIVMLRSALVGIEIALCGAFACHFTLIGAVHMITNDFEKYKRDAKIWVNSMTLLMAVTGFLALAMDYPNTKSTLHLLIIGFTTGFFGAMLDPRRRTGRREENL